MNLLNKVQIVTNHKPYSNVKVCYNLWYKFLILFLHKSGFNFNTVNQRNSFIRVKKFEKVFLGRF